MPTGALTSYLDVAQVVLYVFWFFFFGLILYIRREDKREGYPLESDRSERVRVVGFPDVPAPKQYLLPHGGGIRELPRTDPPEPDTAAEPVAAWPGAPLHPTGNPMKDAVGAAAYAIRREEPDLTHEGEAKIVPMRVATDFSVEERDPDPRGKPAIGADGKVGGTITDIWVDRAEPQIRYLELEVEGGGGKRLLPINFCRVARDGSHVKVLSLLGSQFQDVPTLANPDQITLQEEDKVCAYYAGGHLYAKPSRTEPWL